MSGVHQFVPAYEPGAVGRHVRSLRDTLVAAGYRSDVYADRVDDRWAGEALAYQRYDDRARPGDRLVYHHTTGSQVADYVVTRSEPVVLACHDLAEPRYSEAWDDSAADSVWARRQLRELASRCEVAVARSRFDAEQLLDLGFGRTVVVPVGVEPPPANVGAIVDARLERAEAALPPTWLFAGHIEPKAAQHEIVKAFAAYAQVYGRQARLELVGATLTPRYEVALRELIARAGLDETVILTGSLDDGELAHHYEQADVFVSMARREGSGHALLEAMRTGLGVVAVDEAAAAETAGGAAVLVSGRDPLSVAVAARHVCTRRSVQESLARRGLVRVEAFRPDRVARSFAESVGLSS